MVSSEKKYYDLNLATNDADAQTNPAFLKLVESAIIDGYTGFALNVFKRAPLLDKDLVPIPLLNIKSLMKQSVSKSLSLRQSLDWDFSEIEQYSRITIEISDQKHAVIFTELNKIYKTYDIIAVRPTNEKMFLQCCTQIDCDIISLDLGEKLGFYLKKQSIGEALSRGVTFEICYSKALADTGKRRYLFRNAIALAEICKGKGLILSSEASDLMMHRSPLDAKMMSSLLGVEEKYRDRIICGNCEAVINRASIIGGNVTFNRGKKDL